MSFARPLFQSSSTSESAPGPQGPTGPTGPASGGSGGLVSVVFETIPIPTTTINQYLTEPLYIPSAGDWQITGMYEFASQTAQSGITVGGTVFSVNDGSFGRETTSQQLYSTANVGNNSYIFTHTISNVINFGPGLTYPFFMTGQISVNAPSHPLFGKGYAHAIKIN